MRLFVLALEENASFLWFPSRLKNGPSTTSFEFDFVLWSAS